MSDEPRFSVDVEPPSEARWDKLEQRLMAARARDVSAAVAAPPRRRVHPVFWAAGAAVAAAVVTLLVVPPRRELIHGTPFDPPAPIAVEGASRLIVGDATIVAGEGARLEVVQELGGIRVTLAHGDVDCEVAPRGSRPPFLVQAGDVTVKVVGTRFVVHRSSDHDVSVDVLHGTVEVVRAGAITSVTGGQSWHDGAVVATATAPPPSVPSEATAPAGAESRDTSGKKELERAEALERKDPAAAQKIYESLLDSPHHGVAARARYSLAFIAFNAKHYDVAARHAARYQRQFPTGKNAEDVLRLEILSYYHLDDPRRREAARRYLDAYPTGTFAEKARQIANWQ